MPPQSPQPQPNNTPQTTTQVSPTGVLSWDSIPGHTQHTYPNEGGRGGLSIPHPNVRSAAPTGENVVDLAANFPVEEWNDVRGLARNHSMEHPILGQVADKMDALQELLFGGQSVGKPMGTSGGVADEAQALAFATDAPEIAQGAVEMAGKGLSALKEGATELGQNIIEGGKEELNRMATAKAPLKRLDFTSIDGHQLLQEGRDFTGNFEQDNFASRRTTGNNMFDPESLVTGEEMEQGLTPQNSRRVYPSYEEYLKAVHGDVPSSEIASRFPRKSVSTERSGEAGFFELPNESATLEEAPETIPQEETLKTESPEQKPVEEDESFNFGANTKSTLDQLKEVYPTTTDPESAMRGASFITPEGEFMPLGAGVEHPQAIEKITGKAAETSEGFDNRPEFLTETGLIRTRMAKGRDGNTLHFSLPSTGITPEGIAGMKQLVGKNKYGNIVIEVAEKGGNSAAKQFASVGDVDDLLKEVGMHPDSWTNKAIKLMNDQPAGAIDPRTGNVDTEGYGVEVYPEARATREPLDHLPTRQDLEQFHTEHKDIFDRHPELRVGWYQTDKGYELNIGAATKNQAGAVLVGRNLDQKAAWDIGQSQEIPTGGMGEKTKFKNYSLEDRLNDLSGRNVAKLPPTIRNSPHLTDEEKYLLGSDKSALQGYKSTRRKIASVKELAETAKAGEANRFWYDRAKAAFDAMFDVLPKGSYPAEDREKFIGLVAATSPRADVTENMAAALDAYRAWVQEGRPSDPYQVREAIDATLMMPSTHGPNAARALTNQPLSGPKVTSFYKNFMGSIMHVTNDMWGALTNGIVDGKVSNGGTYIALSENYRKAAESLGWTPQQAQAASWGFIRTLGNMAGYGGKQAGADKAAEAVLQTIDDPAVRKYSADIAEIMLTNSKVRDRIQALGIDLEDFDARLTQQLEQYGRGGEGKTRGPNPRLLTRTAEKVEQGKQYVKAQRAAGKTVNQKAMPLLDNALKEK